MRQTIPALKQCYARLLEDQPQTTGRLVFRFTITEDGAGGGRISDASVLPQAADAGAPELIAPLTEQCMLNALTEAPFPSPQGGSVTVTYPFSFAPSGDMIPGTARPAALTIAPNRRRAEAGRMPTTSLALVGPREIATRFAGYHRLSVRQRKRWWEILLSFEMRNAYDVYDQSQQPALRVQELGTGVGAFFKRMFLGPLRPFRAAGERHRQPAGGAGAAPAVPLHLPPAGGDHRGAASAWAPSSAGGRWLRRIYVIEDAQGRVVADLFGPILRPWTFELRVDQQVQGIITKRWTGLLKEMFTDADNFGVDLARVPDPQLRALAFAATVLIDVVHFERAKSG